MNDVQGLTQEVLEIRPPCLEVLVPNSVVVYLTHYGLCSGGANLVLLYKDTILKNIKLEGDEKLVRFDLEVQTTGIINVVVISEQTEPADEVSSVAPLPVLPGPAAQELGKVFENTVQAAKSIVMRTDSETATEAEQRQYLLVEGHVLSDGQEQAIRHMLWKERFRPFAADLDFLLNNPLNDDTGSPGYASNSPWGDSNLQVAIATTYRQADDDMDDGVDGSSVADSAGRGAGLEYLDDSHGAVMQAMNTETYGQVLKGMLKFLSDCNAWRCFFYVMNECAHQGVLFTGLAEVGIQGLYELPPSGEGSGGSLEAEPELEALLRMTARTQSLQEGPDAVDSMSLDEEVSTPSGCLREDGAFMDCVGLDRAKSELSPKASAGQLHKEAAPLLSSTWGRARSLNLGTDGAPVREELLGQMSLKPDGEPQLENEHRLGRSSSLPAKIVLKQEAGMPDFSYKDLQNRRQHWLQGGAVRALWPQGAFPTRRHSADTFGIVSYLLRVDGASFSMRLAMALVCLWLCLVAGSSDMCLGVGTFCLGLSALFVGGPAFVSIVAEYRGLLVVASRIAVLFVLLMYVVGSWDCPCIPSWSRQGRCLGGILQSVVWLVFMSFRFKAQLWTHIAFIALEAGVFMLAVSQGCSTCHSSRWLVIGPALLGEVYSFASVAWREQELLGGRPATKTEHED
eukprot:evm.model.scf_1270.3 EVM.evm.TU.scf_1270.3   scf_1270:30320-34266(+)